MLLDPVLQFLKGPLRQGPVFLFSLQTARQRRKEPEVYIHGLKGFKLRAGNITDQCPHGGRRGRLDGRQPFGQARGIDPRPGVPWPSTPRSLRLPVIWPAKKMRGSSFSCRVSDRKDGGVDECIPMQAPESKEGGVFESGDQAEDPFLLLPFQFGLKPHQIIGRFLCRSSCRSWTTA